MGEDTNTKEYTFQICDGDVPLTQIRISHLSYEEALEEAKARLKIKLLTE